MRWIELETSRPLPLAVFNRQDKACALNSIHDFMLEEQEVDVAAVLKDETAGDDGVRTEVAWISATEKMGLSRDLHLILQR